MDVSVIIPVHNGGELVHEQLDALARQRTQVRWEVVVGDNLSTDGSAEAVRARAEDFPVPLHVVPANRVAGLVRILEDPFRAEGQVLIPRILHGRGALSGNMAVLREVFVEVGGFDESLPPYGMEDSNLSARVLHAGHTITPAPEMVLYFRPPPRGVLPRLRKTFRSGQSEVVIWSRGLEQQGHRFTYPQLALDVARVPVQAVKRARTGGIGQAGTWAARQGAVRPGRLVGLRTWVRSGRAGEPVHPLLEEPGRRIGG